MSQQTRTDPHTALVISHAHPDFSKGGAEVAAHGLFTGLNRIPGWNAYLLARHGLPGLKRPGTPFVMHGDGREILFDGETDHFYYSNRQNEDLFGQFLELLRTVEPDVVHFHHYWNVGVEWILAVKRHNPQLPVVMTLHEYLAICLQNGQMLKTNGQLCHRSAPALCHSCLPQYSVTELFQREHFLKSFFSQVDLFVAPSQFLKDRYVAWGLPAERIVVLENGQEDRGATEPAAGSDEERPRTRFAYFGQINPFKGIDLLLDAFARLPSAVKSQVQLEIHGGGNPHLPEEFRTRVDSLLASAHRNVRHYGPYAPEDQAKLIQDVDWVIVPSIWWENSPMVIQEAFLHGKPVICADIGGMAEKVRHQVDGLHFRARNASALAQTVERAASTPGLWKQLVAGIRRPPDIEESARQHSALYLQLLPTASVAAATTA